jgi:hypothetical protein
MNNINIWNIDFNIDNQEIIDNFLNVKRCLLLLDLSKSINEYSIVEQIVYNIASFHFNRLNISLNDSVFVEFWFKSVSDTDKFHLDCDEVVRHTQNKYIHPLLSCVTYLNDHNCPTILTNIDLEIYKYKDFEEQTSLFLSFPRLGKHITFEPDKFHGTSNLYNNNNYKKPRYMLAINLWNKKPENIPYYDGKIYDSQNNITELKDNIIEYKKIITNIANIDDPFQTICVSDKIINFNLFEKLLYKKEKDLFFKFEELISENNDNHTFKIIVNNDAEKIKLQQDLKNKYGNIIDDINAILDEKTAIKYNRFLQRFQFQQIYTNDICRWIINECENYAIQNGGWTKNRHNNYPTTDLPIDKVKTIFYFIIESLKTISLKIKQSYNLNDEIKINFVDVFVVKYKFNEQSYLEIHKDGSFLSFNILLSNPNDFEGGGTYFDDGLIMTPEQGDLILHSSKMNHSGLPITKGTRYLLVGFVNLELLIKK